MLSKKIKNLINKFIKYREIKAELEEIKKNPEIYAVEGAMTRGINWYNYKQLSYEKRQQYFAMAQNILRNEVYQNETNKIIADLVDEIAKRSKSYEQVISLRMTINGLELLRNRLSSIQNPEKIIKKEDPYNPI